MYYIVLYVMLKMEEEEEELLKFAIKKNKSKYSIIYDSLVMLQNYIAQMNYTVAKIHQLIENTALQDSSDDVTNHYFYRSLQLASQIPVLEIPCDLSFDVLTGDFVWATVFTKIKEFMGRCRDDINKLKSGVVAVSNFNSRKLPFPRYFSG